MTITSPHNEQLTQIRKLAGRKWRDKLRLFVAEGEDLIEAAERAGWEPEAVYVADDSGLTASQWRRTCWPTVSQLGSGTRAIGIYGMRWAPAPVGPVCLALWGVNDPGNVGTALRSALAFGAGSVALGPGSADPYGHKAVRASMGALFDVPVARVREPSRAARPQDRARRRRGCPARADRRRRRDLTLVVGAEREGLPASRHHGVRRGRAHPDPHRVAERRDGGDRRPVRGRP